MYSEDKSIINLLYFININSIVIYGKYTDDGYHDCHGYAFYLAR